jgi:MoaA/NifB/PqqE/SkfB family radical SAM enzyme
MYADKSKLHERQRLYKPGELKSIALDVTPKCDMGCSHCYAETFFEVNPIELNVLKKALDEAYELGVFHYILQGGEPTEDPERLEAIIKMIYPDETYINVVTNGWRMTREMIYWLKDLKVDKICFSLDSGLESEHDKNRKVGSYICVLEAIDNVIEAGLLPAISIVVTHQSLYSEGFKKAYEYTRNKRIRLDVQIAEPVGKWDGVKEHLITQEDSLYIKQLQQTSPVLPNGQDMIKRDIYSGCEDRCPAGTEFMGLTTDGHLLPCNFLQYSLGNIRDRTIKEMRDDLLTNSWFDGKHPNCIIGEDHEFIDTFVTPYRDVPKPLDAYKVFNLKRKSGK